MVQNSHTDRQVKHNPKVDTGFIRRVETPLSVGLPLTIHQQVRDKNRLRVLSIVYLGTRYENVLNITKRIEHAVVLRMKDTGGYCLPAFIKKCITVFFANIDFLKDTSYGQCTLHGCLIVMNQEEDENAEPINQPLTIPDKPPSNPPRVDIKHNDEPVIQLTPIKFTSYKIDFLKPYHQYDETWALASHMANDIDDITPPTSESPDTAMVPTPGHDFAPNSEGVVIASIPDNIRAPSSQASEPADNTYNKFNVTQRKNEREAEENLCHAHMGCYKIAPAVRTTCKSYQQRSGSTALHDILNRLRHIVQRPHPHSRDHGCCGRSRTVHRHHTLHNFTGADWGGKCFGISKKSTYLCLPTPWRSGVHKPLVGGR